MAPRPRHTAEDFDQVASGVATGRHQRKVAGDMGWTLPALRHCLNRMRAIVATRLGVDWLDPQERTAVEIAQAWVRLRADSQNPLLLDSAGPEPR